MLGADGHLLLQSLGFDSPKEAAFAIGRLQKEGTDALAELGEKLQTWSGSAEEEIEKALQFFAPEVRPAGTGTGRL